MVLEVAAFVSPKVKLVRIVKLIFDGDLTGWVWSGSFDGSDPFIHRIVAAINSSDKINPVMEPRRLAGGHSKLGIPKVMRIHRSSYTLLASLT